MPSQENKRNLTIAVTCALSLGLYLYLAYQVPRTSFLLLLSLYALLFALYLYLLRESKSNEGLITKLLWFAVLCRVALLFSAPQLSDDIGRYLWDGSVLQQGISPFAKLPVLYRDNELSPLQQELVPYLMSRSYFASYPPLCQLLFYLAAFAKNIKGGILLIKVLLLPFELGVFWALKRLVEKLSLPKSAPLLYALNPLVIIELAANAHLEAVMIFFTLLLLLFLLEDRLWWAMFFFGMAIAAKTLPVIFVPILWRYLGLKRGFFALCFAALISLLAYPLVLFSLDDLKNYREGLSSLMRVVEFNSSFYRLLWWFVESREYFPGAFLALSFGGMSVFALVVNSSRERLVPLMLIAFTWQLLCSAIVHPWYLSTLLALSCLSSIRFPVWWSLLIPLSYITYTTIPYEQSPTLVFIEYALLFIWCYREYRLWRDESLTD